MTGGAADDGSTGDTESTPLSDAQLGSIAARLALYPQRWVERRVQGIQFIDDTTVRQRVSVTLRHPPPEFFVDAAQPAAGQTIYVPLELLSKVPLRKLDVADEDGATFAIPATARNGRLASFGLTEVMWGLSVARHKRGLSERSVTVLDRLVTAPPGQARRVLSLLDDPREELGELLGGETELRSLAEDLAENFMLLAPVVYRPGVERVLKYSCTLPLPWSRKSRNLGAYLGLCDFRRTLTRLPIGSGNSYHLAIDAPDDVRLTSGRLTGRYVTGPARERVTVTIAEDGDNPVIDLHARRPTAATLQAVEASRRQGQGVAHTWPAETASAIAGALGGDPLAAASANAASEVQSSDRGFAELRFRPRLPSIVPLTATSILTAVGLLLVRPRLGEADNQTMAAVVLSLPIVAASYLARPGEHRLSARLVAGFRGGAVVVGACALCVAAILGLGFIDRSAASGLECRPSRGPDAVRGERICRPIKSQPPAVPEAVQRVADGATSISCLIALTMLAGSVRIATGATTKIP